MARVERPLPVLKPCPDCGVELPRGRFKHGLVAHGCKPVESSETLKRLLLQALRERLYEAKLTELTELYRVLEGDGDGKAGASTDLLSYLARD